MDALQKLKKTVYTVQNMAKIRPRARRALTPNSLMPTINKVTNSPSPGNTLLNSIRPTLKKRSILVPSENESSSSSTSPKNYHMSNSYNNREIFMSRRKKDMNLIQKREIEMVTKRRKLGRNRAYSNMKRGALNMPGSIQLLSQIIDSSQRKNFTGLSTSWDRKKIRERQKAMIKKNLKEGYGVEDMHYRTEWLKGRTGDTSWKMIKASSNKW
jgi:hypothetical protein